MDNEEFKNMLYTHLPEILKENISIELEEKYESSYNPDIPDSVFVWIKVKFDDEVIFESSNSIKVPQL